MLVDFLIASILIGLLRRGKLKSLGEIPFRGIEAIFASFFVRFLPLMLKGSLYEVAVKFNIVIVAISYFLLLYALLLNWKIRPMRLVALGVFLNFLVIMANGGKMPVSVPLALAVGLEDLVPLLSDPEYLYHTAVDGSTKLSFLGDVIPLPPPYPKPRVFSLGDLAMGLGIFFTLQEAMLKKSEKN